MYPKSTADLEIKSLSILSVMQKVRSIELMFAGYTESFNLDYNHEQHYIWAEALEQVLRGQAVILYLKYKEKILATGTTEPLIEASAIQGALVTQSQIFQVYGNVK